MGGRLRRRGAEQVTAHVLEQAQGAGVMVKPRQPRLAWSNTANTSDRQLASPGRRPIIFTRRRVSPKERSMKLEWRIELVLGGC